MLTSNVRLTCNCRATIAECQNPLMSILSTQYKVNLPLFLLNKTTILQLCELNTCLWSCQEDSKLTKHAWKHWISKSFPGSIFVVQVFTCCGICLVENLHYLIRQLFVLWVCVVIKHEICAGLIKSLKLSISPRGIIFSGSPSKLSCQAAQTVKNKTLIIGYWRTQLQIYSYFCNH